MARPSTPSMHWKMERRPPKTITWTENKPKGKLVLLQNGKSVKYTVKGNQVTVTLPSGLKNEPLAFKFNSK